MTRTRSATASLRVLLIEDDEADVFLVNEILKGGAARSALPAFELLVASTLAEGLQRLREEPVDVILLDLMLPDSRGMDSLRKVVAQADSVPVVVLSNMNDEAMSIEAARNGAQDYLVKGHVEAMWLARIMRYAVARKNAIRGLRQQIDLLTGGHSDSEDLLAPALNLSGDPFLVLESDGTVRCCNAAMTGMAGEDLTGKSLAEWTQIVRLCDPVSGKPLPEPSLPPETCADGSIHDRDVLVRTPGRPEEFAARLRAVSLNAVHAPAIVVCVRPR